MSEQADTIINTAHDGIEIFSVHVDTGSSAMGYVPTENVPKLIEYLNKIIEKQK